MSAATPAWDRLLVDATLCTLAAASGYGLIERGAIGWRDGKIAFVGTSDALPDRPERCAERVDALDGALVTPGLVDCHTHLVFAGNRADEFEWRLNGRSYEEIARAGGGIMSTVTKTRAASAEELFRQSLPRARALRAEGVTTIEIKSGYGLELESERKMLQTARRIGVKLGICVRTTYLAAHAPPPEWRDDRAGYIGRVCEWLERLAAEGLVDAVDGFCEGIGFSRVEIQRVFDCARRLKLPVKLHADQLSDLGGAALAAEYSGLSADHIEYSSEESVRAMARSGTVGVLLPGAFYSLRETRLPPIAALRAHGVAMAVATDLNPGTSPMGSLLLALNQACVLFGLTPEEALRGITVNAARALGLDARKGALALGRDADFAIWPLSHPAELAYWIGGMKPDSVIVAGRDAG